MRSHSFAAVGLFMVLSVSATTALADLPLTIEDLITDKGKVKLDVSLSYANSDRQGVSAGEPIIVQVGPTSFVTLPIVIGESQGNSDSLVGTLGLRYGLTPRPKSAPTAATCIAASVIAGYPARAAAARAALPMHGQA